MSSNLLDRGGKKFGPTPFIRGNTLGAGTNILGGPHFWPWGIILSPSKKQNHPQSFFEGVASFNKGKPILFLGEITLGVWWIHGAQKRWVDLLTTHILQRALLQTRGFLYNDRSSLGGEVTGIPPL